MIVFARQCIECGASAEADHHVIPRSRGGTATVPLCGYCHALAHNMKHSMSTGALAAAAVARLKAEGKHVHSVPYGYRIAADGRLEPRADQQKILRRILSLRKKMSIQQIASTLNADGVPTSRGKKWQKGQIHRVVAGRAPAGCTGVQSRIFTPGAERPPQVTPAPSESMPV